MTQAQQHRLWRKAVCLIPSNGTHFYAFHLSMWKIGKNAGEALIREGETGEHRRKEGREKLVKPSLFEKTLRKHYLTFT